MSRMAIVGTGIDLVEVARIERLLHEHGERFLERCFTQGEQRLARAIPRPAEHLAGRFAVKEAALKALGTGLRFGIAWTDLEVVVDDSGRPTLILHTAALEIAHRQGISRWWISITHTAGLAMALAVAEKDP